MKPRISIIIPVYNASKYITRCLDSIINQTFTDYELIIVNDGSTDLSLQICNQYKNKDNRIIIINQENQGSSVARNNGLNLSQGEYILNVDSDDWLEPTMLEELYKEASISGADIVQCGFFEESLEGIKNIFLHPYTQEVGQKLLKIHMGYSALWNKLIKKKLYSDYKISGIPGITMWEDNVVTMKLRYHSKCTICLQRPLYHYWIGQGNSMCDILKTKFPISEIKVADLLTQYFTDIKYNNSLSIRCTANLRLLAKFQIWRHPEWGGVKKWKETLPISTKQIWFTQLCFKKKLFFSILNIIPSAIGNILGGIITKR
ncbi:MAG: glycosyltransferase family 2 protein [Bacteroides sp.]|nr:glycosyltransferase family 2 protein [Bacteroides sp.]